MSRNARHKYLQLGKYEPIFEDPTAERLALEYATEQFLMLLHKEAEMSKKINDKEESVYVFGAAE